MPTYEYKCLDCGKESLLVLTLHEHKVGAATCRHCGSSKLQQMYTGFSARTTRKS